MLNFKTGNLLESDAEALVNTVNTVGVMGKGIALMFKERFPANMEAYARACKENKVATGKMFVTHSNELVNPQWIVNFPTKQHWRAKSKIEWIDEGLKDLRAFIVNNNVRSIAIPPLGAGNGGLSWNSVLPLIEQHLADLSDVDIQIYQPTEQYQNVSKQTGVEQLTAARAMVAELIRRYWVLGNECTLLEVQKLAWFLQRALQKEGTANPLKLDFQPEKFGPYANNLTHLLNRLDGSYLQSDKRIPDAKPTDIIAFNDNKRQTVEAYLKTEATEYDSALRKATDVIEGFESPYGLELLATVDWLITEGSVEPNPEKVLAALRQWPAGEQWAQRKLNMFDHKAISVALDALNSKLH
ncbi:MAG: type II toxin-antitoxin system antitoxin DNA ADP-ribosyl glycohydrolase DarG [Pseudomonadota bacterium]